MDSWPEWVKFVGPILAVPLGWLYRRQIRIEDNQQAAERNHQGDLERLRREFRDRQDAIVQETTAHRLAVADTYATRPELQAHMRWMNRRFDELRNDYRQGDAQVLAAISELRQEQRDLFARIENRIDGKADK